MTNTWADFWRQKNEFDDSMQLNYQYFLKKVGKYVKLGKETKVLDIGSGPGNLEDAWHNKVGEIHGVDISERYNAIGREKHKDHPNVFFHDLSAVDYLNFDMLKGNKFDIVIVMSVIQYYRSKDDVIELLKKIQSLAAPNAQVLLCDLIVQTSLWRELLQVLYKYFKEGRFFSALSLFYRLRFSNYYAVKKDNGFLMLTVSEWKTILADLHLHAVFIKEPLTLHNTRKNILIRM